MPQIINITSEALQATIRRLLPSQQGFGLDLEATNVITPVIDLTPSAEGSELPDYLQTALNLTDATSFSINNTSSTIVNTPGFWRVYATITNEQASGATQGAFFQVSNGVTTKNIVGQQLINGSYSILTSVFDFVVILQTGESLIGDSSSVHSYMTGSVRQIADVNGNLNNPTGYVSQ